MKIALIAPDGRMGRAITESAAAAGIEIVDTGADVLVDFSAPQALRGSIDRALSENVPLLVGTTGLDEGHDQLLADASADIAVLRAPNTSLGVALLADLVTRAARILGPDEWDIEIVEAHHRHKADAPSGTALHLGLAAERGRGEDAHDELGRCGTGLSRETGEIGYAAVRGGTVAGDHDVLFLGPDERLILSHRAESRAIFARGALTAAKFLHGRDPGLYTMADVIAAE
ncbi:4-hydroxy-tetrahydrodipicolinate reductase [Sphingomicrobium astaxanthinifaciens]|uniref:4-hydroxy-tetrahydrodipicolinate reductase n=1 Tax=Sphingomicrobium astaxanthinifaciens TaxID=1227949 RepID=UPI001FCB7223|nr:4-hydroxy-tetrahydrodipicolinate reductase [Sphingomicrobium astaxanthinifaciens]MCJ7421975.1 4-hydroxy-tetrahydrodipicolinate reductase [Sphingomicrobium astaxanthinifaciens]